jgi:hypothetical protein
MMHGKGYTANVYGCACEGGKQQQPRQQYQCGVLCTWLELEEGAKANPNPCMAEKMHCMSI